MRKLLFLSLLLVCALYAQQAPILDTITHHDHVPLAAVPTSVADELVPSADRPSRVIIRSLYFANTNALHSHRILRQARRIIRKGSSCVSC